MPKSAQKNIYTVSRINDLIKFALGKAFPEQLLIKGQISGFKPHYQSGHCYFTLKDDNSVLPCVMWSSKYKAVKFRPQDGMEVIATGYIDVYSPGGKYQLYVDKLEPEGIGAQHLAFEQLKKKLSSEGLFDDKYKKSIPLYPQRIGIITSKSGAALHDIAESIHNRWPCVRLLLYPVAVQGPDAAPQIAEAVNDINNRNKTLKIDVLIVGRGGGSIEDLWAFNEEIVARAIFNSRIPIISAVGHEVDVTIADYVADKRASTPTRAGVVAVPDMADVLADIANIEKRIQSNIKGRLQLYSQMLSTVLAAIIFRQPLSIIQNLQQQIDEYQTQISAVVKNLLTQSRTALHDYLVAVTQLKPSVLLGKYRLEINNLLNRADTAISKAVYRRNIELTAQENRLASLNPKSVLNRGYSLTKDKSTGRLIYKAADIEIGDQIITELKDNNIIESRVTKK